MFYFALAVLFILWIKFPPLNSSTIHLHTTYSALLRLFVDIYIYIYNNMYAGPYIYTFTYNVFGTFALVCRYIYIYIYTVIRCWMAL